jgi:hypothetical protein
MKRLKKIETVKIGLMILNMDIPALLSAVNSKFSPNFPKVIKDESNTDRGMAKGMVIKEK